MQTFKNLGAEFVTPIKEFVEKLTTIRAFITDWDGVFNQGLKTPQSPSGFLEANSMGINLLRFAFWKQHQQMPPLAIITGAYNPGAIYLGKREHFDSVYFQIRNKSDALLHFCEEAGIQPKQVAFFFDDANDLSAAQLCGMRFLIRRQASPLFLDFVKRHQLCDYITAHEGGNNAIREVCELLIHYLDNYDQILKSRMYLDDDFEAYSQLRRQVETKLLKSEAGIISEYLSEN